MEGKCKFERVTKYKFLECFAFVCNICSKVREDHENNGEEAKKKKKKKKKKNVEHPETQQKPTELQWTQSKRAGRMLCVSKIRGKWCANVQ